MSEQGKLTGKKALVTGSGTGIGREIALEFARQGADVALHYEHSAEGANSAVETIRAMGRRATALQANFGSVDEAVGLAEKAIEFLGGMDCLVNNAGITMNKPFLQVKTEQFDTLLNVNLRSPFFVAQRVVQHMLEHGGGAICNLTSIHGVRGHQRRHYCIHTRPGRGGCAQRDPRKRYCAGLGHGRELLQDHPGFQ